MAKRIQAMRQRARGALRLHSSIRLMGGATPFSDRPAPEGTRSAPQPPTGRPRAAARATPAPNTMTLPFNCPFCAHDNPRGARFCNECGSPLHLAPCAHCDAVNDIDMRACYRCGAALHHAAADAAIPTEVASAELDSSGKELRPLADVPAALAKLLRESRGQSPAATVLRASDEWSPPATAPMRGAALPIPTSRANTPAAGAPVVAGSAFDSAMRPAKVETDVEKIALLSYADEPAHSISSDIDVDAPDTRPGRRRRRSAMPTTLAAIVLLVSACTVVGYVAFRQGLLPWNVAPAAILTPAAQPEGPASTVDPATDAISVPSAAESGMTATPVLTPPTPSSEIATTPTSTTTATTPTPTPTSSGETPPAATPAVAVPPALEGAAASVPEAANVDPPANSSAASDSTAPAPRRASAPKADAGVDKDAAATQSIIQRETGGFGPPKPLPPRAPPAPR